MYLFWSIHNVIIFFSWIPCLSQYIHSDNLSFQCTTSSMWLTNRCTDPNTWLTHQLEKNVGCKVFQFIHTIKIKKLLGYKTLWRTNATASSRERWIRANSIFGHNLHKQDFTSHLRNCATFDGPQNNPYICLGLWEKKA